MSSCVTPADDAPDVQSRIEKILADERNIVIAAPALEVSSFVVEELSAFKFARQRSKLAGEIRGSNFVIKGEY